MQYTKHRHNKPGQWLKYLTTQRDVGIQTNPNYDLAQPHDDLRATEGDYKHQLSCRLCKGYTHGIQCQACLFNYCTFCMGPTGYYCLRSDCISTFQTLDTFAERQKKPNPWDRKHMDDRTNIPQNLPISTTRSSLIIPVLQMVHLPFQAPPQEAP